MIELTDEQLRMIYGGGAGTAFPPVNVNAPVSAPVNVGVQTGVNTAFNVGVATPVNLWGGPINTTLIQSSDASQHQYQTLH